MFDDQTTSDKTFVKLTISIVLGVFVGLLAFRSTEYYVAYRLLTSAKESFSQSLPRIPTTRRADVRPSSPDAATRARLNSQTAIKLRKDCDNWTQFHRDNPNNRFGVEQKELTCQRYNDYINTGLF